MRRWLTRTAAVLAVAAPLALVSGAAANHEPMDGMSFLFLQPPFTQDIYGTQPGFAGGVAFAPDGDPYTDSCLFSGSPVHRYDKQGVDLTAPPGDELHPRTDIASNAGCGMTNHPDGFIYSNIDDGTNGVSRLDASTGAPVTTMGPPGNALGIAVDPLTNHITYVGEDCRFTPTCTIWDLDPTTGTSAPFAVLAAADAEFVDGILWEPGGSFLMLSNRSPSFRLTVLNRAGGIVQHVPMTSEPDGISFHATAPKFVVTNNLDGTMTRFDFPADNYALPPVQSLFASGGFRGDLSNVGPDGCIYLTQAGTRFDDGALSGDNSLVKICPGFAPPPGVEICGDGIDNDGDGQIDEDCPTTHVVQHYESYDLAQPERVTEDGVTLVDQFGSRTVRIEEIEWLMNPVEKRRTGREPVPIEDADAHLTCYGLPVLPSAARTVHVRNQFTGDSTLRIGRPLTLCAPAAKTLEGSPGEPPTTLQHYECYDVTAESPRFTSETLGLRDQFGTLTARLDRARELCNPVEKRRTGREPEPIVSPDDHLVCYRIVSHTPAFSARTVFTRDQFGLDTLRVTSPRRLCVPSEKSDGPPAE